MRVDAPTLTGSRVELTLQVDGSPARVHWVLDDAAPAPDPVGAADAALTASLLTAMARQEPLVLEAPVSPLVAHSVGTIQDVFETWARQSELLRGLAPVFRRVPVDVTTRAGSTVEASDRRRGRACFFSGGLDSLASAISHRHEDVTLVYVHGLDVALGDEARRARCAGVVRHAASSLGLSLVEVETDVREFTDRDVDWLDGHGAALAGVAHLLGPAFQRVYVPGTETYATIRPLGSHPLVDPLWSSERVELVYDGATATRLDKLRLVDGVPVARETLHVCVSRDSDEFNCGRCWKCVTTMIGVRVLGLDERFPTLPVLGEREFLQRIVESSDDASLRTWDRHRTTWAPYLAEARTHLDAAACRRLEAALTLRFARAKAGRDGRSARKAIGRRLRDARQRVGASA